MSPGAYALRKGSGSRDALRKGSGSRDLARLVYLFFATGLVNQTTFFGMALIDWRV